MASTSGPSPRRSRRKAERCLPQSFNEAILQIRAGAATSQTPLSQAFLSDPENEAAARDLATWSKPAWGAPILLPAEMLPPLP